MMNGQGGLSDSDRVDGSTRADVALGKHNKYFQDILHGLHAELAGIQESQTRLMSEQQYTTIWEA